MSDFNKDELEFLFEMLTKYRCADLTRYNPIVTKVKCLIDNYTLVDAQEELSSITKEIARLQECLANRPSAEMDPFYNEVITIRVKIKELREQLKQQRKPSKMIQSQSILDDKD